MDSNNAPTPSTWPGYPIPVNKGTMAVFEKIFTKPYQGELPWSDFNKAMESVGWTRDKKAEGSRVSYKPPGPPVPNKVFKPHCGGKTTIEKDDIGHICRDLNKLYGWDLDSFVLASNEAST
ncbi:hypothetical protein GE09DRAFT_1051966 [Coniochaeta sp. 2T2.1]|nr:hypothetical protein GE09DRAFT_1051966 [Coniochaeta sp. 2T2.1]